MQGWGQHEPLLRLNLHAYSLFETRDIDNTSAKAQSLPNLAAADT